MQTEQLAFGAAATFPLSSHKGDDYLASERRIFETVVSRISRSLIEALGELPI